MKIHFTKMHGLGNDFILIDCREQACPSQADDLRAFSKRLCDRRIGIGADQLLLLHNSRVADFQMRIINADGSEVEMCGNGIRCLAHYIWERNLSQKSILEIETLAGIIRPERFADMVKVDMGEPVFDPVKIPVNIAHHASHIAYPIIDYPLLIADKEFKVTCISMGNPHAVVFVDDVSDFPVPFYGPMIENHSMFPRKTNVEFIQVLNISEIKMRVWERGAGETMACGTGASAAAVASRLKGLTGALVTVHLLGGDLFVEQSSNGRVFMTGPAVTVFEGTVDVIF